MWEPKEEDRQNLLRPASAGRKEKPLAAIACLSVMSSAKLGSGRQVEWLSSAYLQLPLGSSRGFAKHRSVLIGFISFFFFTIVQNTLR